MNNRQRTGLQPLDKTAFSIMVVLLLVVGLMLLTGNRAAARVRDFSWQDRQVGTEDTAFILTFSRPMDHDSVEANLRIDPPLTGKTSWAGRRMAYTLAYPAPYGTTFDLELQGARDRFAAEQQPTRQDRNDSEDLMQPFQSQFRTRDRAFAYIGISEEEWGRLVLYNLTQQDQVFLTPADLVVLDFEPYPTGDRLLFSATDRASYDSGKLNQQLYTVTTGLTPQNASFLGPATANPISRLLGRSRQPEQPAESGIVEPILDSQTYQNLKFDLSPDGQVIVVQRVNQDDPTDFGPWVLQPGAEPRPLQTDPGGDFLIAPDSQTLALSQGEGLALVDLTDPAATDPDEAASDSDASTTLEFLPTFGMVLSFAPGGSTAAMVKFSPDYTQSLFLVTANDEPKELARIAGSILDAQFDPTEQVLYCLMTELLPGETYVEQPFLTAIDLETGDQSAPLVLPNQPDIQVSLAPDGLGLLFDQTVASETDTETTLRSNSGIELAASQLWLLPLDPKDPATLSFQPEALPLEGLQPHWLP